MKPGLLRRELDKMTTVLTRSFWWRRLCVECDVGEDSEQL